MSLNFFVYDFGLHFSFLRPKIKANCCKSKNTINDKIFADFLTLIVRHGFLLLLSFFCVT